MTFLYVVLSFFAVTLILLCIRVVAVLNYEEEFSFVVKWLFFKFVIFPKKENEKKKKDDKPREKKKKEKQEKQKKHKKANPLLDFYHNQGVSGVLDLVSSAASAVKGMFRRVFKAAVIRRLSLTMRVSGEDAAQTAIAYGKVCAAVFPALGAVCSTVKVKKHEVNIMPDFNGGPAYVAFSVEATVVPLKVLTAILILAVQLFVNVLLKLFIGSRTKEEKQTI